MRIQKRDSSDERRILTGMIVDPAVCGRLAARWDPDGMFRNKWANLVGGWCVQFHQEYDAPPAASIESIFEAWASKAADEDTVKLVDRFIVGLSGEYEAAAGDVNPDYIVDLAGKHFNRVRLEKLAEEIQGDIEIGQPDEAAKRVAQWSQVEVGGGHGIDLLTDMDAIREAFEMKAEPIITYPGDLGKFYGDDLERDSFVGFMGATGRGKTWWLLDVAWRALLQRRKVAFFEVGDMSQAQILRRFMVRASRHPLRARTVRYPTSLEVDGNEPIVEFGEKVFDEDLEWRTAWKAIQKRAKAAGLFKLSVHPNSSINVAGVESILMMWERQGWVPDVIVIDYADILAPPAGTVDSRDQINATWKQLRSLSQSLHCCVITATQSDAASYAANTMSRSNFSEDRRKLDHVTGMIGINMTEEEKEQGVCRLNWIKRREEEYTENRCVFVAGTFALGAPAMKSAF